MSDEVVFALAQRVAVRCWSCREPTCVSREHVHALNTNNQERFRAPFASSALLSRWRARCSNVLRFHGFNRRSAQITLCGRGL